MAETKDVDYHGMANANEIECESENVSVSESRTDLLDDSLDCDVAGVNEGPYHVHHHYERSAKDHIDW